MNIEVFCLCDAATADAGKLSILGAFDTIWTVQVPAVHPQCAVAVRLRFTAMEGGVHPVQINIVDADGQHVVPPVKGDMRVEIPHGQPGGSANLILSLQGLKFGKQGVYSIDLAIDGRQEASLPLYVRIREMPVPGLPVAPPSPDPGPA